MKKIKCLICEKNTDKIISNYVYGGKKNQKYFECSNCKIAILYPTLSKEEEKKFYQREFEVFMNKRVGNNSNIWKNERRVMAALGYFILGFAIVFFGGIWWHGKWELFEIYFDDDEPWA